MSLISRLYDVDSGSVCVGGKDVRSYDMEALRDQVAVVLQKNVLFSGTILENLRWGREDATEEECAEACRLACADEFIERFPDGYNTWIEQGGNNVSGGQKQRLCIARALLKNPKVLILDDSTSAVDTATDARIREAFAKKIPGTTKLIVAQRISSVQEADLPVLILDEATSSIDTRTEKLVQEGMDALMNGRTTFVIAHRLSTVRNSDCIMVLEQGRIIERGTHDQLIAEKVRYYQLYTGNAIGA